MTETLPQTQVRLQLEAVGARAFRSLIKRFRPKCALTLVVFDYSEGSAADPYSNLAYCTSLVRSEMAETIETLVKRWAAPPAKPTPHDRRTQGWLPDEWELRTFGDAIKKELHHGVGFALVCGRGERTMYIGTGEREGVAKMLADDLLPGLRGEVAASG